MDHVAGYVLVLDMTARHIQEKLKKMQHPWLLCKGKKIQNHFFCIFAFLPFWTKTQLNQNFEWI